MNSKFSFLRQLTRALVLTSAILTSIGVSAFGAPALSVTPPEGPPTTTVVVSGSGFGADVSINIFFDKTGEATTVTSGTGTFSSSIRAPTDAQPGEHAITAVAAGTGGIVVRNSFLVRTNWAEFGFVHPGGRHNYYENVLTSLQSLVAKDLE